MATKIQIRRDTEADWLEKNPVLSEGELGFVSDTSQIVVGDGSTAFVDLPRFTPS